VGSHRSFGRRLAVATVVLGALAAVPVVAVAARGTGATATTGGSSTTAAARSSTSRPRGSTTTTTFGFDLFPTDAPNPLRLYPRRPDARYDDIEAAPKRPVSDGLWRMRVTGWSIVPHAALPAGTRPARLSSYRTNGFVEGFSPVVTTTSGDLLRVGLRAWPGIADSIFDPNGPQCVATWDADGSVIVPYDLTSSRPRRPAATTTSRAASTTFPRRPPTTRATDAPSFRDVVFELPIGARRGRFYFTCELDYGVQFLATQFDTARAVWAIDV